MESRCLDVGGHSVDLQAAELYVQRAMPDVPGQRAARDSLRAEGDAP